MKKRNLIKRNSGFVIGCVLAGGASFFAADAVMTDVIPDIHLEKETEESQSEQQTVLEPEQKGTEVYETDPFTVMASGSVIKGVESEQSEKQTESQSETQTEDTQNPENTDQSGAGETDPEYSSGDVGDGEYTGENGESGEESYGDETIDGQSGQTIEIYDPGNGEYAYTDDGSWASGDSGNGDGSWTDDGSGSGDGSWTDDGSGSGDGNWTDDGSGNGDGSWTDDGSGSGDGSWTDDGSGSGDGSWTDDGSGSGDGSWTDDGSGSNDGAWTPDDVIIWGISSRYIDESELYNYNQGQLRLIRNEIFALNGRIFRSQDLMDYFSQKSWYVPAYDPDEFDANMFYYLNDYEEANLQVILNYEAALGY
ncbi:MAG: YARHG domain-containing protein [Lachnospiraceae bacterium]|nr:YARHG domain-containing protein [Lachnospiraceae bacterium]